MRIAIGADSMDLYNKWHNHEGWLVCAFAEWWEGIGADGRKHFKELDAVNDDTLDETEENFIAEWEKKEADKAEALDVEARAKAEREAKEQAAKEEAARAEKARQEEEARKAEDAKREAEKAATGATN